MSADEPMDDLKSAFGKFLSDAARLGDKGLKEIEKTLDHLAGDVEEPGRVTAEVTSAVALTDEERRVIEERLHGAHGDDLPIRFHVDPSILGGVIVRVGDRYIDGSIAARLGQLRQELTGTAAR